MTRAISHLLDDPVLRAAMGEAGRRRVVEAYTWPPRLRELDRLIAALDCHRKEAPPCAA
jgi:glycosyltransferase involved in cell wall biosynthesis